MNSIERFGMVILIICLVVFLLTGCAGYSVGWDRGETHPPVKVVSCGGKTTDWPCLEAHGCSLMAQTLQ